MDRRYRRTEERLTGAMLKLINEKPLDDITIDDIVSAADIARKTFYAHYENKQQLLWHSLESHFQSLETRTSTLNPDTLLLDNKPLSYPVFKHVEEYALFYKQVLAHDTNTAFIVEFWDYIAHQSYEKHEPLRDLAPLMTVPPWLIAQMLSGALVGALRWWLQTDMQDSAEQMAYRFSQLMAPGVLQSMGLDL